MNSVTRSIDVPNTNGIMTSGMFKIHKHGSKYQGDNNEWYVSDSQAWFALAMFSTSFFAWFLSNS